MPTYNYRCTKCEKTFDVFHSMSDSSPRFCPYCGGESHKLMSAGSVIFKGHGFYSTDYRDSGYLEAAKKDSKASEAPKKSDAAAKKTETPAAAKTSKADTASK